MGLKGKGREDPYRGCSARAKNGAERVSQGRQDRYSNSLVVKRKDRLGVQGDGQ